jgi:hypothetical protein
MPGRADPTATHPRFQWMRTTGPNTDQSHRRLPGTAKLCLRRRCPPVEGQYHEPSLRSMVVKRVTVSLIMLRSVVRFHLADAILY